MSCGADLTHPDRSVRVTFCTRTISCPPRSWSCGTFPRAAPSPARPGGYGPLWEAGAGWKGRYCHQPAAMTAEQRTRELTSAWLSLNHRRGRVGHPDTRHSGHADQSGRRDPRATRRAAPRSARLDGDPLYPRLTVIRRQDRVRWLLRSLFALDRLEHTGTYGDQQFRAMRASERRVGGGAVSMLGVDRRGGQQAGEPRFRRGEDVFHRQFCGRLCLAPMNFRSPENWQN
ncbi:hypothetical protein Deipe_4218 (plasmid) [Deinococcus peraridilitoris DSM 19664]|uniref:Uncharacterized protein n=1 Tax=Deinococcus peraridilitoris (strain DSM 19664 / LMG 22246 / CIP 109416 / KR-200) TaxID=937777 RepID=L0A6S5_DEIPD|nr:hypothetical protein Deipe_4218 [Deinococcus peraridilitoris DSM 19664]